ncbi:MAG: ATP-binding protein, partial [Pseudomonadota bacterium]
MAVDYEKLGLFYLGRGYDGAAGAPKDELVLYDARDLTTHAVVVGMTGSGKTGLCISLLEEAAIDGIPALVIDPKGDIGNLAFAFPELRPEDFAPWVDPADARRRGLTVDALAAQTAETWRKGLASWHQEPARIARFRDAAEVAIYTPGSDAGRPLSILRSFAPPAGAAARDPTQLRDRIGAVVSGVLGLVGVAADPLKSREHILLSSIVEAAWREGRALDLAGLIASVQKPPFDKVGVFDLDTFYPPKERLELAMALNGLFASPGFAAWLHGEPIDVQKLLYTPEGKPRVAIVSIAHLNDAERMFVVTLVLNELVGWMRAQPGTSSLRAIFYMDEIFGYFPPSASPPSKPPMLTLLKQARAFGLGLVLATQNPVDLDYKGLGNAGTWFIGRLQTERDKARVLEGLESALGGAYDRATLDRLMSSLGNRVFLLRNVHEDHPVLMQTRWALSYLRGPLALPEIQRLGSGVSRRLPPGGRETGSDPVSAGPEMASGTVSRPALPADVAEAFVVPTSAGGGAVVYRPQAMGAVKLHYVDAKTRLDLWTTATLVAPLGDDGRTPAWSEAQEVDPATLEPAPLDGAGYAELPGPLLNARTYAAWSKSLAAHAYESCTLDLQACDPLGLVSNAGETEGEFRARLAFAARERR